MLLLGWCVKRNSCYYCGLAASCPDLWVRNMFLCLWVSLLHEACARGHSLTRGRAICFPSDQWTQGSLLSSAPPSLCHSLWVSCMRGGWFTAGLWNKTKAQLDSCSEWMIDSRVRIWESVTEVQCSLLLSQSWEEHGPLCPCLRVIH